MQRRMASGYLERRQARKGEQVEKKMKVKDLLEYNSHRNKIWPSLFGLRQALKQVLCLTLFFGF